MAGRSIATAFVEIRGRGDQLKGDVAKSVQGVGDGGAEQVGQRIGTGINKGATSGTRRLAADVRGDVERAGQTIGTGLSRGTAAGTKRMAADVRGSVERAGAEAGNAAASAGGQVGFRFRSAITEHTSLIGQNMAAGFAAFAAADVIRDAVTAASDLSEEGSKSAQVFGAAAGQVRKFADGAVDGIGQSARQALEYTGILGNLLVPMGLAPAKAAEMSTSLVALGSDMASFNNTSIDEALDAIRAGLVGESEPLRRFGVMLSAADIEAKALAMGLAATKGELTASAKAQATYALIMEQTKLAQGDFARTSAGLANQQRILAARTEEAKAKLGGALLPVVNALLPLVSDLAGAAGDLGQAWSSLPGPVQAGTAALIAWMIMGDRVTSMLGKGRTGMVGFTDAVRQSAAAERAAAATSGQFAAAKERLADTAGLARLRAHNEVLALKDQAMAARTAADSHSGFAAELGRLSAAQATAAGSSGKLSAANIVAGRSLSAVRTAGAGLMGALGGPWGLAIAAGVTAIGYLSSKSAEAKARQDAQTSAIREYAQALKESNGAVGDSIRVMAAQKLEQAGVLKVADQLGVSLADVGAAATGNKPALAALTAELDGIIKAGTTLVVSGKAGVRPVLDEQAQAAQNLKGRLAEASGEIGKATGSNQRLAAAAGESTAAAVQGGAAQTALAAAAKAMGDQGAKAADKVTALKTALDELAGKSNDLRELEIASAEALAGFPEAFGKGKVVVDKLTGSITTNTEAGRKQGQTLIAANKTLTEQLVGTYEQALKTGHGQESAAALAMAAYSEQRQSLVRVLTQMTGNRKVAEQLAKSYLTVPSEIETAFRQPGMASALADAARLGLRVQQIPGTKNVLIRADTQAARDRLEALGYKITRLPDGRFGVVLTGAAAVDKALDNLTRPRKVKILAGYMAGPGGRAPQRLATGGRVIGPGTGTSDDVLARVSNDEHVIRAEAARRVGYDRLDYINRHGRLPAFADGGRVGGSATSTAGPRTPGSMHLTVILDGEPVRGMVRGAIVEYDGQLAELITNGRA